MDGKRTGWKMKEIFRGELTIITVCLLTLILFIFTNSNTLFSDKTHIQIWMRIALICCVTAASIICKRDRQAGFEKILCLIMAMGIIMRVGYMLYTPYELRGHDIGTISGDGHMEYISRLMNGVLPDSNSGQFYHPPLYHIMAAGMCRFYQWITGEQEISKLMEAGKLISCWASILTLFVSRKLCRETELGKRATVVVMSVAAFLPEHYLLAGRLNNDSLSVMFMTGILLYTLRWYRNNTLKDLMILAFLYGFGLMTKLSIAPLAMVTGIVMGYRLLQSVKQRNTANCLRRYCIFALIAFPIGLWYPIRNKILFHQPFNYVLLQNINGTLYCGNYSYIARFMPMIDAHIYADPFRDYNIWVYLIRTSIFGEFKYEIIPMIPIILLVCNLILAGSALFAMVDRLTNRPVFSDKVLGLSWVVLMASYLWFNIKYPFGCTMDFRYIVPTALIGSVFLGKMLEEESKWRSWKYIKVGIGIILGLFSITSCIMYTMI